MECFQLKHVDILEWSSQNPATNLNKNLLQDWNSSKMIFLEQFSKNGKQKYIEVWRYKINTRKDLELYFNYF